METAGSLPRSQEPATSSYSEPDQSCSHSACYSLKIRFNIIRSSTPAYCTFSLPSGFLTKIPLRTSPPAQSHTAILLVRRAAVTKNIQFRCYGSGDSLLSIKMYGIFRTFIWKSWRKAYNTPVRSAGASYIQLSSVVDVLRWTIRISWNWRY
jgi:hypothetical protein